MNPCEGCRHCARLYWTGEADCSVQSRKVSVQGRCPMRRQRDTDGEVGGHGAIPAE